MEDKFVQQLKKGVLDMVVLKLVSEQDTYGYEIIQQLERRGGPDFKLKDGTLYPVLYRLEDGGYIRSAWKCADEGGRTNPKKYYSVTPEGQRVFREYREAWKQFNQSVEKICEGDSYDAGREKIKTVHECH